MMGRLRASPLFGDEMLKTCPRCKKEYERTLEFFAPNKHCGSKDGMSYECRECRRAEKADIRARNRDKHNAYNNANYHKKRKESGHVPRAEMTKRTREERREYFKNWRAGAGREWTRTYANERRKNPVVRLRHNIGVQMRNALKKGKGGQSWQKLVGYTADELRSHLEAEFEDWMNWDNYGSEWHIDHIRPIASFNLPDDVRECWAMGNLRPLSAKENMSKGTKIV
jgi:hypothetical protein